MAVLAVDNLRKSYGGEEVVAGVSFRIANRANLDVIYAYPLDSMIVGGPRQTPRVLVNLTASIL